MYLFTTLRFQRADFRLHFTDQLPLFHYHILQWGRIITATVDIMGI